MPRRLLKRLMPEPDALKRKKSLRFMHHLIADPALWALSRRTVANACMVGLFCALLPIPFQMVVAAFGAWALRCNLALSVGLVWVTNPLTMPVVYYATYRVGAWMLDTPARVMPDQVSAAWFANQLEDILPALALGSLVSAVVLALLANMLVRLLWRYQVVRNWRSRRKARLAARRCSKEQSSRQNAEQDTDKL
ncbi:ATP-binding protein [Cobetia amphilecti]|uniref:DUF2062 domain-containing protein n=1 Tax=Cobetia TaxID=204286 RepID=UPI000500A908|nr:MULTISPECIES: DUF2062 domain-containing protein [Cobetia]MBR9753783.1 DUF2062 domain-containing protein [Gammaproteobacteria bacterium]TCJ25235.1 DUF2062 domain-containing protein [Halomonas sp. GDM18]UTV87352.1 DUF2062 domain-containing protein [Cobetia litoralis]KGA03054.1 ATP-binding protein [Cobetia amphilecti]MBE2168437.1 DUF2062 domain-containing protein [Cobetia sp. 2AS1]